MNAMHWRPSIFNAKTQKREGAERRKIARRVRGPSPEGLNVNSPGSRGTSEPGVTAERLRPTPAGVEPFGYRAARSSTPPGSETLSHAQPPVAPGAIHVQALRAWPVCSGAVLLIASAIRLAAALLVPLSPQRGEGLGVWGGNVARLSTWRKSLGGITPHPNPLPVEGRGNQTLGLLRAFASSRLCVNSFPHGNLN